MKYVIRRILINIPVLFAITVIIFTLINLAPGDALDFFTNEELGVTRESLAHLEEKYGLNDPIPIRYGKWLWATLQGDLGYRFLNGDSVAEVLKVRIWNTLILTGSALLVSIVLGVSLGVFIGLRQYSFWDFSLTWLSFVGNSIPAFVAGIFGLYLFSVQLNWLPSGGMYTIGGDEDIWDLLKHMILPAGTLAIFNTSYFMRYTRFAILEVKKQDYMRTAEAKGLKERIIVWRHALRNALLPVVTYLGVSIHYMIAGALFLETIYSWPGMGSLFVGAVMSRDYPMVMGIMLVTAIVVLITNLITDLSYGLVDPRIKHE